MQFSRSINGLLGATFLIAGSVLLGGCGGSESGKPESQNKAESASQDSGAVESKAAKRPEINEDFDSLNKPLRSDFEAPSLADEADYADIQKNKLDAIRFYNVLRGWNESDEEIASSISGAILVQHEAPKLYEYETQLKATDDAFEKRELTKNISKLVKEESEKVRGSYRVRLTADASLKPYDFETRNFVSESCLFSEKLDYSKDEMRSPAAFANAQKPRCYIQPSTTNFLVGIVNGSKLNINVADESTAKLIEKSREGLKYEIYGYIRTVERETLGGKPTDNRKILIEPQKISLISQATGKSIYSQDL